MEKPASQSHTAGCKPLTTFVQTDTHTFREVVQRLTGPSESHAAAPKAMGSKRPTSQLHERRQWTRPKLHIAQPALHFKPNTLTDHHACSSSSPANSTYSLSPVSTPSKIFSRLSIVDGEKEDQVVIPQLNSTDEEKAIKERRFYLLPSPRSMPGYTEPELLTLFPLESPKTTQKP